MKDGAARGPRSVRMVGRDVTGAIERVTDRAVRYITMPRVRTSDAGVGLRAAARGACGTEVPRATWGAPWPYLRALWPFHLPARTRQHPNFPARRRPWPTCARAGNCTCRTALTIRGACRASRRRARATWSRSYARRHRPCARKAPQHLSTLSERCRGSARPRDGSAGHEIVGGNP